MPIALHDLCRECRRFQSKSVADCAFNFWIDMCMRAHCAAYLTDSNALAHLREPFFRATEFVEHEGKFQAECYGLSVHAVAAPDHRCHLEPARLTGDCGAQAF